MAMVLTLLVSALACASQVQVPPPKEQSEQAQAEKTAPAPVPDAAVSLSVSGRLSLPGEGKVSEGGEVLYSDLLGTGAGVGLDGELSYSLSPVLRLGGFLSLGWDRFGGTTKGDSFQDAIKSEGLDAVSVVAGPLIRGSFLDDFFWEARLGVGWTHSSAIDATVVISGSSFPDREIVGAADRLLGEAGARVGWRSGGFEVYVGVMARYVPGAPRGRDADLLRTANVPIEVDPAAFYPVTFEFGLAYGF
jgi:hypothetical protein